MTIKLLIALTFVFFLASNSQGQNINVELSKLFFNVDVSELDSSLLGKFYRDTSLHKSEGPTDTVFYPLRNRDAKYLVQRNFAFKNNSFLKTQFVDGNLGIIIGQDYSDKDFTALFLAFEFKNNSGLDSAYSELTGAFQKLGQLETSSLVPEASNITNAEDQKRVEIFKMLFPKNNSENFILYVYLKKLKK